MILIVGKVVNIKVVSVKSMCAIVIILSSNIVLAGDSKLSHRRTVFTFLKKEILQGVKRRRIQ